MAPAPTRPLAPRILKDAGRSARVHSQAESQLGPHGRPLCRWCLMEILAKRRRTFCSDFCVHQWRLRSDPGYLRDQVFARDRGLCALCSTDTVAAYAALKRSRDPGRAQALELWGMKSITARRSLWDADHIRRGRRPVRPRQPPHPLPALPPRGHRGPPPSPPSPIWTPRLNPPRHGQLSDPIRVPIAKNSVRHDRVG